MKKGEVMKTIFLFLSLIVIANCQSYVPVEVNQNKKNQIVVNIDVSKIANADSCFVYRSYFNFNALGVIDLSEYPISETVIKVSKDTITYVDSLFANNIKYFYYIQIKDISGKITPSYVESISVNNMEVLKYNNKRAAILIDKKNYFLEIKIDDEAIKRYPVNLGLKPWNRKLHFDKMSTPEGKYHLTHFNYKSLFHLSMGVSYPNSIDRKRYTDAIKKGDIPKINNKYADIGGSITIHGGGIGNNWTWGCIAMRNDDIDEMLSMGCIKINTPIYIVGNEVTRKDLY